MLCCTALATALGLFAVAGERRGLWEPLEPAPVHASPHSAKKPHQTARKRVRHRKAHRRHAQAATSTARGDPGPPVPARMAFLFAAVAAALAALTAVLQSGMLKRALRHGLDTIGSPDVRSLRPKRGERATGSALRPRLLHGANVKALSLVARHAIHVGGKVKSMNTGATRRVRSALEAMPRAAHAMTVKLVRAARPAGSAASALFAASRLRLGEIRTWRRHLPSAAPYLVSITLAVVVGWVVGTH